MKILVTGCAGFIGSHLCEELLSNDHIVYGIDNINDYYDQKQKYKNIEEIKNHSKNYNFYFYHEDIRKTNLINDIDFDIVCNLAAMAGVRYSIENPLLYSDVNIIGTLKLLEDCVKNKVKKFIYASSSSVYGLNKKIPFCEKDNIEKCNSPYAVSKLCNESYAKMYNQLYGINTIGLRFFTVYGPRGRPDMAPYKFIKKILNNDAIDKYGTGETMRDYTYISDIVSGIMGAINLQNKNENKIYNLGNNSPISLNNFIKLCEEVCDKKALITQKDNQLGDVPVTYADIILASKELNYSPKVLLKDGLLNLKKWLEKNV